MAARGRARRVSTEVGFVDLGCNPAIQTGGKLETWMGAGMLTIGIGGLGLSRLIRPRRNR